MPLSLSRVVRRHAIKAALQTLSASLVTAGGTGVTLTTTLAPKVQGTRLASLYAGARAKGSTGTATIKRAPSPRRVRAQLLAVEAVIAAI